LQLISLSITVFLPVCPSPEKEKREKSFVASNHVFPPRRSEGTGKPPIPFDNLELSSEKKRKKKVIMNFRIVRINRRFLDVKRRKKGGLRKRGKEGGGDRNSNRALHRLDVTRCVIREGGERRKGRKGVPFISYA